MKTVNRRPNTKQIPVVRWLGWCATTIDGRMRIQQQNPSGSRQCWNTARERNRIRARFAVRHRIMRAVQQVDCLDAKCDANECENKMPPNEDVNEAESLQCSTVQAVLNRIILGDRSFFSLQNMEAHFLLLNASFPASFLWSVKETHISVKFVEEPAQLLGEGTLISRFGRDFVTALQLYLSSLETCTMLEYTVWLKRYYLTRQLILGGINPCIRSTLRSCIDFDDKRRESLARDVGPLVQQRFINGGIPVNLSIYIVKRVIDFRRCYWEQHHARQASSGVCTLCQHQLTANVSLCFDGGCGHVLCEPCLWYDIMNYMYQRCDDIVPCPICYRTSVPVVKVSDMSPEQPSILDLNCTQQRRRESFEQYHTLPSDGYDAKKSGRKKKAASEHDILCSTWSDAVKPLLGFTQALRREKYFAFVDKGAWHYVKGCLDAGIDVNLQNEYGQTALFISVFRKDLALVRLLLEYGSDPYIPSNGGMTCLSVATYHKSHEVIDELKDSGVAIATEWTNGGAPQLRQVVQATNPTVTTLIDCSLKHEGAGAFLLDEFLTDETVDALVELWRTLPIEETARKKSIPCSVRSYYCDAHHCISTILRNGLNQAMGYALDDSNLTTATVYPHMRFLCYAESGATLAPHVDLCRCDGQTGRRSTHSFLLYLTDCERGGETSLIGAVSGEDRGLVLAVVIPKRGRLLVFPHRCPHEGMRVEDVPKLLIRGEVWLPGQDSALEA